MSYAVRTRYDDRHNLVRWFARRDRLGRAFVAGNKVVLLVSWGDTSVWLSIPEREHWLVRKDWRSVLARGVRRCRAQLRERSRALAIEMDES